MLAHGAIFKFCYGPWSGGGFCWALYSRLPEVDWSGGGCCWHIIFYLKFVVGLGVVDVVDGL